MQKPSGPILLSAPRATEDDIESVVSAIRSGWLAPAGPDLKEFEVEIAAFTGVRHAVALSSGTAALHLGLKYLGVKPGDHVLVPTVTFAATAFAVSYLGAIPVFVDIEDTSWNLDSELAATAVDQLRSVGHTISAAIPVDLYGTPADYSSLEDVFTSRGIPCLEDAAEALGSRHGVESAGSLTAAGVLSFNGNKIITTSGGGMLLTDCEDFAERVRFWSTQSRENQPWYEHEEIGYNYRMSNILAALGRSQLRRLPDEVAARRGIRELYREFLSEFVGVTIQEDPPWGRSNAWLTVVRFDSNIYPDAPTRIREALESHAVESRPVWKPMHRQPVFASNPSILNGTADLLFREGLCLPSGSSVTVDQVARISTLIGQVLEGFRAP